MHKDPIEWLAVADPDLAALFAARLKPKKHLVSDMDLSVLVEDIIQALSLEASFGSALADGYLRLIGNVPWPSIRWYQREVHQAAEHGATLGGLVAAHLPPVLLSGKPGLSGLFFSTIRLMLVKGLHLLNSPLQCLTHLLSAQEPQSAIAFLNLLTAVFSTELTYNRAKALARLLSTTVTRLSPTKRSEQLCEMYRVACVSPDLVDPFIDALDAGLYLLDRHALARFVSEGLIIYKKNETRGKAFLGLSSHHSRRMADELQVSVPLSRVRDILNRYLQARIGARLTVNSLSVLSAAALPDGDAPVVCSDGRFIYLPDEINVFETRVRNESFYKLLAKLEAGYFEFGTYDFDLEKLRNLCPEWTPEAPFTSDVSDMEGFFLSFSNSELAQDLFSLCEFARLRILMQEKYPGMWHRARPSLLSEVKRLLNGCATSAPADMLMVEMVMGAKEIFPERPGRKRFLRIRALSDRFERMVKSHPSVETTGLAVLLFYPLVVPTAAGLPLPFGRRVRPDLVRIAHLETEQLTSVIRNRLQKENIQIFRSDLRRHLMSHHNRISSDELALILQKTSGATANPLPMADLTGFLSTLLSEFDDVQESLPPGMDSASVFRYPEWDERMADYQNDHVRVVERTIPAGSSDSYRKTLQAHRSLIRKIRYAFELLKPEELTLLRHWTEGDEFDYRALIDAAIDRKIGRIPSDRLYNKRLKHQRDVAVMLLVDLSRSTAALVPDTRKTILDIEMEAIVLFCEALLVVGDSFAVTGFSGTGRLSVDFWHIKAFDEPMGEAVRGRICAISPQRSTRMGAAIRHAVASLEKMQKKTRLLITLGDGFPNDTEYKGEYAVADTRKAIAEARAKGIHLRPITVNPTRDPQIFGMYGRLHHNVISDVRELPDKLWRIYNAAVR